MKFPVLSGAIALSCACGQASAAFVGGGVVSLQAWNDAANATALPGAAGGAVRVYRIYAAFDGQDSMNDQVNSVFGANIFINADVVNITASFPSGDIFENAAIQWDSFATINVRTLAADGGVAPSGDGDGINWGVNSLTGGWFVAGSSQGLAGTRAGADDFGSGLYLVMLAQVTVFDTSGSRSGDLIDLRSDGWLGTGGNVFGGYFGMGVNNQTNPAVPDVQFLWPTPGAATALLMAGAMGMRRRRD